MLESVESQTFKDFEVCMVKGVFPQGKAINNGAADALGDVFIILDFDVETAHNGEEGLAKFKQKKYSLLFANNQKRSRCSSAAVTATPSSTDR